MYITLINTIKTSPQKETTKQIPQTIQNKHKQQNTNANQTYKHHKQQLNPKV